MSFHKKKTMLSDDETDDYRLSSSFEDHGFLSPIPHSNSAVFFPPLNESRAMRESSDISPIESKFNIGDARNMPSNPIHIQNQNQNQTRGQNQNTSEDNSNTLSENSQSSLDNTIKSIETFGTSVSDGISNLNLKSNIHNSIDIQDDADMTINSLGTLTGPSFSTSNNFDQDATPKLNLLDKFDDITPKIGQNKFDASSPNSNPISITVSPSNSSSSNSNSFYFDNNQEQKTSSPPVGRKSPSLPQQHLSSKFKRLSVAIQQSTAQKSRDSFHFLSAFQQNVNNGLTSPEKQQLEGNDDEFFERKSPPLKQASSLSCDTFDQEKPLFYDKSKDDLYSQHLNDDVSSYNTSASSGSEIPPRHSSRNTSPQKYPLTSAYGDYDDQDDEIYADETQDENEEDDDDDDLSAMFIRALHPFESSSLESDADASICLSFSKNDLAFIHTIDASGWGEVTLINDLSRGWVPMNYFSIAVKDDDMHSLNSEDEETLPNSQYLKPLLRACGKFLNNPLSYKTKRGRHTFSIAIINAIRDGVRFLLQEADCLSRSNEIVTKRPIVRKIRKSLLADWYKLMVKANEFKGTSNFNKIEILTLMVYEVTRKAVAFLNIWSLESKLIIKRKNEKNLQNDMGSYPLLKNPPMAKERVASINYLLYSYLGLIIGRVDMIEHNPIGCEMLESLTHQIILLLRELLFISKTGSTFSKHKSIQLDNSLDTLLSLVSDLVASVKNLVAKTLNETEEDIAQFVDGSSKTYYYTQEGGNLIQIASKMVRSISKTISSIKKMLDVTGDFKLNSERSYPDYSKIKLDPDFFIKKCSVGLAKAHGIKREDTEYSLHNIVKSSSVRYSMMRSGKTGELILTPEGANMIGSVLLPASESFRNFTDELYNAYNSSSIQSELMYDAKGMLIGASFKGLVFTLTDEVNPPDYFFVSTFFLCFRIFASGIDLIEELITRFDVANSLAGENLKSDGSYGVKMKSRRRLISKMFQIWLESYWDHNRDSPLLSTLMNFFNEGVSTYLPNDANKLIEITARLSSKPLIENEDNNNSFLKNQLVKRSITTTQTTLRKPSMRRNSVLSERYSMVDGYELSKINTNSSTHSLKSMSLPLPLGIGNQTSSSTSLLSRTQLSAIEKLNLTYRSILGTSWCNEKLVNVKSYIPIELENMLRSWEFICTQSWILSSYRPNLLDFNGLEIAKQLTLIESSIFCAIKPGELLNDNFSSKKLHLKLAVNINRSFAFTNSISAYVFESLLQPNFSIKQRVNTIKNWLKIAISCLYLRNFNSLAAIMTALQSFLITRLTKVWAALSSKYTELYDYLSSIIHPNKNYSVYRTKLKNFLVSNEYKIPIVPYMSLFLQDLTSISEGNSNTRKSSSKEKIINIDKYLKISRIIGDIELLQVSYVDFGEPEAQQSRRNSLLSLTNSQRNSTEEKFTILPLPALQELILLELWKVDQLNSKDEDRAWKLSCEIQPKDQN